MLGRKGDTCVLIKSKDDESAFLKELELRAAGTGPSAKQAASELRIRKAGLKGESESAYLIDFHFERSPNWAVIHDLRLEHRGRTAQIDHLLINRWLDIYVLESKHFNAGLKITQDGEFLRWDDYRKTYTGMASPLEQNERHIAVLQDVTQTLEWPQRLGLRIAPTFHSLILIAPTARIDRAKRFDSSRVIKADQLKKQIDKSFENENAFLGLLKVTAKIVSGETVEFVARRLTALHRPLVRGQQSESVAAAVTPSGKVRIEPTIAPPPLPSSPPLPPPLPPHLPSQAAPPAPTIAATSAPIEQATAPACKTCSAKGGEILYGKFGYYFKCDACEGNTAIRFTCHPGHKPRLRKDGSAFYRECADCGSSTLYHRNRT
jgi:hypothetical protein